MNAREELTEVFGEGGHGDNADRFAAELYGKIRAEVIDDLVDRCAIALSNCCSECDVAINIVRGRGRAALAGDAVPERATPAAAPVPVQSAGDETGEAERLRAELAQAIQHRDHWHAELMCADARIAELSAKQHKGGAS